MPQQLAGIFLPLREEFLHPLGRIRRQTFVLEQLQPMRLAQAQPIVVDGSRVEEIDTAILQLLTSLWCSGAERGIACSWSGASAPLRQTAVLIGVDEMLRFPALGPV